MLALRVILGLRCRVPCSMSQPASTKPYLIRALFDWCVDGGFTPYIVVAVDERTRVPAAFVRDGQIVLNIAPYATHQLAISNEEITCQARFGGVAHSLYVPISRVAAIYARENGQGMAFELGTEGAGVGLPIGTGQAADDEDDMASASALVEPVDEPPPSAPEPSPAGGRGGHLRVIK